jgi:hypothetical protein
LHFSSSLQDIRQKVSDQLSVPVEAAFAAVKKKTFGEYISQQIYLNILFCSFTIQVMPLYDDKAHK